MASSRMIRWKMRLMEYSYKIVHKPGITNVNADVLSRLDEAVMVAAVVEDRYWVESCPICAAKKEPNSCLTTLGSITEPSILFNKIGIDFIVPLPTTDDGNRYIFVITDFICRHGAPKKILSDQGKGFLSKLINEICDYLRYVIKKINTRDLNLFKIF